MLTSISIQNFKKFDDIEIELGSPVVFIGPNNSGKTSALQALALWNVGLKKWIDKKGRVAAHAKRTGVTINRRDLISCPTSSAKLLWRDLHVRNVMKSGERIKKTNNILIKIVVNGVVAGVEWQCGLEFDYANDESFYCRPFKDDSGKGVLPIPDEARDVNIAYLPPMSGLSSNEVKLEQGAVNVLIGQGRTAEILRNVCFDVFATNSLRWGSIVDGIHRLFGVQLKEPRYEQARGEITLEYVDRSVVLDISSSGRGLQQTLLLLAYLYSRPDTVLVLDEPDAHLEILRQRQIYNLLCSVAGEQNNQLVVASHSEVLLNEAAGRDVVVAFLGKPHRIDDRGSQLVKSLKDIGFDQYYQAECTGWVLYVEGSTDITILREFAIKLRHAGALQALENPFVKYVGVDVNRASAHYYGLREAVPNLKCFGVFDRIDQGLPLSMEGFSYCWKKREIENYLCFREALDAYARDMGGRAARGELYRLSEQDKWVSAMDGSIDELIKALETVGRGSPWDENFKVSDYFFEPLFKNFFKRVKIENLMNKKNFYELVRYVPLEKIDNEIVGVLDRIAAVHSAANPSATV